MTDQVLCRVILDKRFLQDGNLRILVPILYNVCAFVFVGRFMPVLSNVWRSSKTLYRFVTVER